MMKEILALIESKKREFSQLPFFEYLRDQSIAPRQRLAFAPCAAPFIMSFGELNRLVFRDEPTDDPIQEIINKHTYEDDHHWLWFLEDLDNLGLNPSEPFVKTLKFLWSDETSASRQVAYDLYHYTVNATPIQKLVIIETIEATGNVALKASSQAICDLQVITEPQEYKYFGINHLIVDSEHYFAYQAKDFVESIQLTQETKNECFELIDKVFLSFAEYVEKLLIYARTHSLGLDQETHELIYRPFKLIEDYRVEAVLSKTEKL
jgi:hypothetical protein